MPRVDQSIFVKRGEREVPLDFVLTPGGFRPQATAHHVPAGHHLRRRGDKVQIVHRQSRRIISRVSVAALEEPIPDIGTGWITYAWWLNDSGSPISQLSTKWSVPPAPEVQVGQTVFLFNALEDAQNDTLVQPVLQWGISHAGGGPYWAIGNWYIDAAGHAYFSDLVQVQPGDLLTGVISLTDQNNNAFSYRSSFQGHPQINLDISGISELVWASQTLEAYRVAGRRDYPGAPVTSMSSIFVAAGGANPPVDWQIKNVINICGEYSSVINAANPGGQVDIDYGA